MKWISFRERLPGEWERILLYRSDVTTKNFPELWQDHFSIGMHQKDGIIWICGVANQYHPDLFNVTHWMSMDDIPKPD